ncbi:cupin [Oleiphilus messinensis]|uniref:Cupin n=1 Tax=Oleiphilus messinensis TaxID=141451 RepID=A0A1Y0I8W5_9GAMM|nr:cupin domain-containing protein [Oleiphilus messinensis]ARU56680.1 cupin [Oleiphilus messinensis]
MNTDELIKKLKLEKHPFEGGYFRRTYTHNQMFSRNGVTRALASSIYYLLTADDPIGCFHRNKSDIVHCYQRGGTIEYTLLYPNGLAERILLGNQLDEGQRLQFVAPAGVWKGARLISGAYTLISEVVVPEFNYRDNEIASRAQIEPYFSVCDWDIEILIGQGAEIPNQ